MTAQPAQPEGRRRLTQTEADIICARHDRLWTARPGGARAVFAFCDLSGLSLRARNLCDADFSGALMAGTDLSGARLDNANLFAADLYKARLTGASMRRCDLRGASLRGADLSGADLFEADLREGALAAADKQFGYRVVEHVDRAAHAQGASLVGANLERSRLTGIVAVKADFTDAVMKDCKLVRANLKQATMKGVNLSGADLSGADLTGADLRDAVLTGASTFAWRVDKADMTGVLTDAAVGVDVAALPYEQMIHDHARWCETGGREGAPSVFNNADLRNLKSVRGFNLTALSAKGAVFYGLDMEGVQLQGAHLEDADLRACNLRRADLRGARLARAKLSGSDLRDAQMGPLMIAADRFLPCDLTGAVLKNADLARVDLRRAKLNDADLSWANFTNAMVKDAEINGALTTGTRGFDEAN